MEKTNICKSIFKNQTLTKEIYTQIWIELISTLEKAKIKQPNEKWKKK